MAGRQKSQYVDASGNTAYRFSFGPWNMHTGTDPFGPAVRGAIEFAEKIRMYKGLGFDAVQFHDDDAVPDLNDKSASYIARKARNVKEMLDGEGLVAEFVAPRLWEDPRTIDGAYTSNDPRHREYAIERSKRAIDIANELGTHKIVLWLAREGTYIRESKDPVKGYERILGAIDMMLGYDENIHILGEPKPNEPMDQAYVPTVGDMLALAYMSRDPKRVGVLIESAHIILAGLDPSDQMGAAIFAKKLWSVHLNDQNGLKYDQDKAFGSVNFRRAFNQVYVLEKNGYGRDGAMVGLDVKAMRTQPEELATQHLVNSRNNFLNLVGKVRTFPEKEAKEFIRNRDYEGLDGLVVSHLMGTKA